MERLLTLHVRQGVELLPPLVTNVDGGTSTLSVVGHATIVVGCLDERLSVLRVDSVHDVEEIGPIGQSALR